MRTGLLAGLLVGLLMAGLATPVAAEDVKQFENGELAISFRYPAAWKLALHQPRGVLPDERFSVRATADPTTTFLVAVYRLETPVNDGNLDATLERQDRRVAEWIAGLPGGRLVSSGDVLLDDALGREYEYEYELEGRSIHADTLLVPRGEASFEISQWARREDYEAKSDVFEAIFASLALPWSGT